MHTQLTMVYWKSDTFWLGKLLEHPEIMTQGETLEELEENLKDAYLLMAMDDVPEDLPDENNSLRSPDMKRNEFVRRLLAEGCILHRHGARP